LESQNDQVFAYRFLQRWTFAERIGHKQEEEFVEWKNKLQIKKEVSL